MGSSRSIGGGAVAALLLLAPAAQANRLSDDFMSCRGITGAAARLACFDRVAASSPGVALADRPDFTPGKPLHVRQAQPEAQAARTASSITVGLVSVAANADGKYVFSLANGQVWQAEDDDPVFPDASGNTVTLTKSVLGLGYRLSMNHELREIAVRRVD